MDIRTRHWSPVVLTRLSQQWRAGQRRRLVGGVAGSKALEGVCVGVRVGGAVWGQVGGVVGLLLCGAGAVVAAAALGVAGQQLRGWAGSLR